MAALPKFFTERYQTLRRDLSMVAGGLLGRNPPPLVDRPQRRHDQDSASHARRLELVEVVRETDDAVSLVLADPKGPIRFVPGQFFTLLVDVNGRTLRRAYSASSDYRDTSKVRVTIKRVESGQVSNTINDTFTAGATVRVLGPSGNFTCVPRADGARHVVLIGGGSGITPLMSIAKGILADEPGSHVSLVYANRSEADVIFAAELDAMCAEAGDRLEVQHLYGLVSPESLDTALDACAGRDGACQPEYYVCGPEAVMQLARETLTARGVAGDSIHEERFSSPHLRSDAQRSSEPQPITLRLDGQTRTFETAGGETILDAGLAAGVPMPYSCAMGGCGACKVKLRSGSVTMQEPNCLTDIEKAQGYVLACVAHPDAPTELESE